VTLGMKTTAEEVDAFLNALPGLIQKARSLR
jgi:hypothetical protein